MDAAPARVYLRDASWHNTIGRGGKYHWPTDYDEARAACSRRIMLNDDAWQDAVAVPDYMRCTSSGCRGRWGERTNQAASPYSESMIVRPSRLDVT